MTNHYHLVVGAPDARLSIAMKVLNGEYAKRFDVRHGRTAYVFRNRFGSELIDSDEYLLSACRYVVLNPVRAGLCGHPTDWPWSSYRALAGLEPAPTFLADQFVLALFDDTYERARAWYRSLIADGLDVASTPRDVPWCLTPG